MSERREPVRLILDDNFSAGMARAADATEALAAALAQLHPTTLDAATWEPHDWSEWA